MKETKMFTIYEKTIQTKDGRKVKLPKASYEGEKGRKFFDLRLSQENKLALDVAVKQVGGYPVTIVTDEYWVFKEKFGNKLVFKAFRDVVKVNFESKQEVSVDDLD